jgi:cell division protein DivIC
MVSRLSVILGFVSHYKYLITVVVGILIVGVFDENSFWQRFEYELQISDLKEKIKQYNAQYATDSRQLWELKHDPKAIERIARERYFMKADDEDIYVLSTDEPTDNSDEQNETTE